MKKNISINISGIIFHIEEDGYETLKKYLDSINRYFSSFEDSSEILADIESRIAEIFLSKLNEEKQVITAEDVGALMTTMGSVSDFKAVEEAQAKDTAFAGTGSSNEARDHKTFTPPKSLMRDQKRKILGGVCAGLGNYFNMDTLWVRLIFAVLLVVSYGFAIPVYILMWVAIPGSYDLDEPQVDKKMFRDPESKVIGGVSGGVAAYLGVDILLVRILFILLAFAGFLGIFLYIILWICVPEARSLTDKMQMQGEPVTLSNIESAIKKNFKIREGETESTITRIILFPFRLIGVLLSWLARIIGPLAEVVRVVIGVIIVLTGVALILSLVVAAGVLFGIFTTGVVSTPWMTEFSDISPPLEVLARAFPGWIAIAAVVAAVIPSLFLILLGASVIARKIVFGGTAGWALVALFFVSVIMLAVGVPRIVYAFHEEGSYRIENVYQIQGNTAVLRLNDTGSDYDGTRLSLRGHPGSAFKLVQSFEAQGSSRDRAIENARMVDYNFTFQDSVFTFDEDIRFRTDAVFRAQRLNMELHIPYDFPFVMDEGISRFISQYVDGDYLNGYTWKMTPNGLECLNCNGVKVETSSDLTDFDEIEITGRFDLRVRQGGDHAVELHGSERDKQDYYVRRSGNILIIDYAGKDRHDWEKWEDLKVKAVPLKDINITITMPSLERIEATGLGTIRLENVAGQNLEIDTRGPVETHGEINVEDLIIKLTGKSEADLSGRAGKVNARVWFASILRAYDLAADNAFVQARGASRARVNVSGTLKMEATMASDIDYRGDPQVVQRN